MDKQYKYQEFFNRFDTNIFIRQTGQQQCLPNHSFGPAIRDHYLLHFVIKGSGQYHFNSNIYDISKNQCFLICPNDITYYKADSEDPWVYLWVGFSGARALQYLEQISLTRENPVIDIKDMDYMITCLENLIESSAVLRGGELRMLGHLYLLLSKLLEESKRPDSHTIQDDYIRKAVEFIEMNYTRQITVQDISEHLNLNRSYFSNLFKHKLNQSPQNFLITHRINKACVMLIQNKEMSVNNISRSVGYTDQLVFSKTFKKELGVSPSDFRLRDALKHSNK